MENKLLFSESPEIVVATNRFIDVPIIVQYESTPMLEVVRVQGAGFTTRIPIYHNDGTYLAIVVGSQLHATEDGKKAGVTLRHPQGATICEINGKPVFEITRKDAAALKMSAELHTLDGSFLRWSESEMEGVLFGNKDQPLRIKGLTMKDCEVKCCRIGIHVTKDGMRIGVG